MTRIYQMVGQMNQLVHTYDTSNSQSCVRPVISC